MQISQPSTDSEQHAEQAQTSSASFVLDYTILLGSMAVIIINVFGLSIAKTSAAWYALTFFKTLSSGYEGALRSLAISLYARQTGQDSQTGKVLGALSVISVIR